MIKSYQRIVILKLNNKKAHHLNKINQVHKKYHIMNRYQDQVQLTQ